MTVHEQHGSSHLSRATSVLADVCVPILRYYYVPRLNLSDLLGWLPSVSGCTPYKLCGGGEGPVDDDNLFTKRRGQYVVFGLTDFLKAFLRHFVK